MKNAMKKLFSLLLVAVLLVGVMPFQAFADGTVPVYLGTGEHLVNQIAPGSYSLEDFKQYCPEGTDPDYLNLCHDPVNHSSYGAYAGSVSADQCLHLHVKTHEHTAGADATCTTAQTCITCGAEMVAATGHTPGADATCTTAQACTVCGDPITPATGHSYDDGVVTTNPTCTAEGVKTFTCTNDSTHVYTESVASLGHNVVAGKCTRSDCDYPEDTTEQEPVRKAITWQIKEVEGGPVVDDGSFTPNNETAKAKDILYYHVFDETTAWKEQYDLDDMKVWSSSKQADVGYYGEIPEGDTVTFVLTPVDDSDDSDSNSGSSSTIPSGSETLKVYARIWVHETLFDTVELTRIKGLSDSALIYQVISANTAYLQDCVDGLNDEYPNGFKYIHWNEDVYYKDDGKYYAVTMNTSVGDENEVYVNLYSAEELIVVNVHTSKTWGYDLSVRVEGFREGDTVTYEDVLKAVKKYYNVSSMKIFTYEEMPNYINGKDYDELDGFIAGEQSDPYEVFITGSRKSGTYTYTADSSNPKTGDAIFAPMIVLGASAACLAVLFFLNKKRAY